MVPFAAVRSFADPSVNFALEFASPERPEAAPSPACPPPPRAGADPDSDRWRRSRRQPSRPRTAAEKPQEKTGAEVVTLDSFRKR